MGRGCALNLPNARAPPTVAARKPDFILFIPLATANLHCVPTPFRKHAARFKTQSFLSQATASTEHSQRRVCLLASVSLRKQGPFLFFPSGPIPTSARFYTFFFRTCRQTLLGLA